MENNDLVVRVSVTINASPDQVWAVLGDLSRYPEWHPYLEVLDQVEVAPPVPGMKLDMRFSKGTSGDRDFTVKIADAVEPATLAWEGGDPDQFYGHHRWTLTPTDEGTLVVDEEVFSGSMAAGILASLGAALTADYEAGAQALKAAVESDLP